MRAKLSGYDVISIQRERNKVGDSLSHSSTVSSLALARSLFHFLYSSPSGFGRGQWTKDALFRFLLSIVWLRIELNQGRKKKYTQHILDSYWN